MVCTHATPLDPDTGFGADAGIFTMVNGGEMAGMV